MFFCVDPGVEPRLNQGVTPTSGEKMDRQINASID